MWNKHTLPDGWSRWQHIAVPNPVRHQLEKEEAEQEQAALKNAPESDEEGDDQDAGTKEATIVPKSVGQSDGVLVYSPDELSLLLSGANRQPDDVRNIMKSNLAAVKDLGPSRPLAKAPDVAAVAALEQRFPNFGGVVNLIMREVALAELAGGAGITMPCLLLSGPPGVGKTEFCKALAQTLNTRFFEIRFAGLSASFAIGGSDLSWGSGRPGLIFNELALGNVANPLCLLDEIDKADADNRYNPTAHLYTLLEPSSAKTFRDEAIPLTLNTAFIQWVATANYPDRIEPALRSRFSEFEIPAPTKEQVRTIAQNAYADMRAQAPWGERFVPELSDEVLSVLEGGTPRSLKRMLRAAFGSAALARRSAIRATDLQLECGTLEYRIGFY